MFERLASLYRSLKIQRQVQEAADLISMGRDMGLYTDQQVSALRSKDGVRQLAEEMYDSAAALIKAGDNQGLKKLEKRFQNLPHAKRAAVHAEIARIELSRIENRD